MKNLLAGLLNASAIHNPDIPLLTKHRRWLSRHPSLHEFCIHPAKPLARQLQAIQNRHIAKINEAALVRTNRGLAKRASLSKMNKKHLQKSFCIGYFATSTKGAKLFGLPLPSCGKKSQQIFKVL